MNSHSIPNTHSSSHLPQKSLYLLLLLHNSKACVRISESSSHHARLWICVKLINKPKRKKKKKMNRWAYQQNTLVGTRVSQNDVVCPKPRRVGVMPVYFHERPMSRFLQIKNQEGQSFDATAGSELLDLIRTKGGASVERSSFQVASSPPFFSGSPPVRSSNPITQDEQFVNKKVNSFSPTSDSSTPTRNLGSCNLVNFGTKPAPAVRIEGFNCSGSCSISALA